MNSRRFDELCRLARECGLLASVEALLGWDERCLLPAAAGEYRAEQMTLLAGLLHERQTDPRLGECLAGLAEYPLAADPASDAGATIRELKRRFDRKTKLPKSLVEELTRATVLGQQAWQEARSQNDFAAFRPHLAKIVELKRQEAAAVGYREHPYDALLDDYEPAETTADVSRVLADLRDELSPLVARLAGSPRQPDASVLGRHFPRAAQEAFGRETAERIGFDFSRGRLDVSAHPFCSGMGPHDCRLTTRYDERHFNGAFFGILHETGHGMYEQGLRVEQFGLPPGEAASLGVHESQSRLWENFVGRGLPFWEFFYPRAQRAFPDALADAPLARFHAAINEVRPSPIRVEADEATYNLHILIRLELEIELILGSLPIDDLPAAWNARYEKYLGVSPPNDAQGVLQDIHWSAGLFGYFATYTLGNLYAAQLFARADADLGGLAPMFRRGDFAPLREWLGDRVHRWGRCLAPRQLIERATGQTRSHAPLIRHLKQRFEPLYGLS